MNITHFLKINIALRKGKVTLGRTMEKQAFSYSGMQNSTISMHGTRQFLSKFKSIPFDPQNPTSKDFFLMGTMFRRMYAHQSTICRTETWKHTKNHLTVYFERLNFMVCELTKKKKRLETMPVYVHRGWLNKWWDIHTMNTTQQSTRMRLPLVKQTACQDTLGSKRQGPNHLLVFV